MATTDTTTIRVPIETRDRLNLLATRRGELESGFEASAPEW